MPRCHILKKHVNQFKSTVKDSDGNNGAYWQPKTFKSNANVALKRYDTPIKSTESSICNNSALQNQSGEFEPFLHFSKKNKKF
jgi:hypothetical protein